MTQLLISVLFSLMVYQSAFAHAGDHDNNCFLTVGSTKLRISGYQFQPELEGKHFCHFFPELGQVVLAVEPLAGENNPVTLELAALTSWTESDKAFTVIKQQPEQPLNTGLASITQTIRQRGIYSLHVTLKDDLGNSQHKRLLFLVGVPVTKIMVITAGLLVLALGFVGLRSLKKQEQ